MNKFNVTLAVLASALALAACAGSPLPRDEARMFTATTASEHRSGDDLLTAGLGADGLRNPAPPAFADAEAPTVAELRRRALWSNWRGIADLAPGGGYGTLYGSVAAVPGREFSALASLPGARQPQRVVAQVPDAFDRERRCLVVTVASGSRGVYGAIAVGAAWGLPRGCAVVHSDKAAGSDYFDLDAGMGFAADGRVVPAAEAEAFRPRPGSGQGLAYKHAHSQDNPEADWGRHTRQAAEFGLQALNRAFPEATPFTFDNTRVIAVGISNGGGAVLRAAELEGDWLDAVVAGEPNVYVDGHGSRALYDYASEAMLLMPCALPALGLPGGPASEALCNGLAAAGRLQGADLAARQQSALEVMRAAGWTDGAIRAGASSVGFDLWRAVLIGYASAYTRSAHDAHPCGYRYAAGEPGKPRPATAAERAAWWSDGSGIPPGAGVHIIEPEAGAAVGVQCLAALWAGEGEPLSACARAWRPLARARRAPGCR